MGAAELPDELRDLDAVQVAEQLRAGVFSARDYARALLQKVGAVEPQVMAWAHLDPDYLLAQADAADRSRAQGATCGALHGVPVGIKDIIDTARLPTENGTVLHAARQPNQDAAVIESLRAAGGLVMGKTVTTELATYAPGKTRNPHNPAHSPGGSSSGSAAAVAAGMVALAIGTQTNGSVIRPASFCGVVGYKPSMGWISRRGILKQSPALDQVGVFARDIEGAALLVECLAVHDAQDTAMQPAAQPLLAQLRRELPAPPRLAFVRTPMWDRVAADAQREFVRLAQSLGTGIEDVELPRAMHSAIDLHRLVMEADLAVSFQDEYDRGKEQLSASLRGQIERGRAVKPDEYKRALEGRVLIRAQLDSLFDQFDAILTPATLGTAPHGLESTGDPVMCTLWTFTGNPAVSLPLLKGANGLPIGVQLVGRRNHDGPLLQAAHWLARHALMVA